MLVKIQKIKTDGATSCRLHRRPTLAFFGATVYTRPVPSCSPALNRRKSSPSAFCRPSGPFEQHPLGLQFRTLADLGLDFVNQGQFWLLDLEAGVHVRALA
jgi:hypothetical protein